ncbi:MAG: FlgD immunoglobulin-like domain containing protein [Rickettsiaceae bacterium]|nr:FlgD immunoglobulin-like domain containing protein [Rickettsiaceae bacterium]
MPNVPYASTVNNRKQPQNHKIEATMTKEEKKLQEVKQNTIDFMRIIASTIKNQNPDKPADSGQVAQTMGVLRQTEETMKMAINIDSLKEALANDQLGKAISSFGGKSVKVDTSKQEFDGKNPVNFQYQMNVNDASRPPESYVCSQIRIYNSMGHEVYKTEGKKEKGLHSFKWDGRDSRGRVQGNGEYRIEIESYFERMHDGQISKTPIESGSYISGRVDSVDIQGGRPKLQINGKFVDVDQIISVEAPPKEEKIPDISEYASYIGKHAVIDDKNVKINSGGHGSIKFDCKLQRPGKVLIRFFDKTEQQVGCITLGDVKQGSNTLKFRATNSISPEQYERFEDGVRGASYLPEGDYTYKIFIQDKLASNPEHYAEISTIRNALITGLDFANDPLIISGDESFHISEIRKLANITEENSYNEYAAYIGKTATINFDKMEIRASQSSEKQYVKIPKISDEYLMGNVYMNVFDSTNKLIARVKSNTVISIDEDRLYTRETLLEYVNPQAFNEAKVSFGVPDELDNLDSIQEFLSSQPEGEAKFAKLTTILVDKVDVTQVGRKFWSNFDSLNDRDKNLVAESIKSNVPCTGFYWDCKSEGGARVNPGEYRYVFEMEKYRKSGPRTEDNLEIEKITDKADLKISEFRKEGDGKVRFYGSAVNNAGKSISEKLVGFYADQIMSLRQIG